MATATQNESECNKLTSKTSQVVRSSVLEGVKSHHHSRSGSTGSNNECLLLSVADLQTRVNGGEPPIDSGDLEPKAAQRCHNSSSGPESLSSNPDLISSGCDMGQDNDKMTEEPRQDPDGFSQSSPQFQSLLSIDKTHVEASFSKLQTELESAQNELKLKEEECTKLSKIREEVEAELHDLTASLFQEAHKMVNEANVRAASSEKALVEANMKIDGLETEVAALKTLVLTSTPAAPNVHLHPHLDPKISKGRKSPKQPHDSPHSHSRSSSSVSLQSVPDTNGEANGVDDSSQRHVDPVVRGEYVAWKKSPTLDKSQSPFLRRLYAEEIDLCLSFKNTELGAKVSAAIHNNTLSINPVSDFSSVPKNCSLLQSPMLCKFHVKLSDEAADEFYVCQLSRNRIAAVCDCLNYLRYITQGLVKSHVNDVYWEIMQLRRKMALARMGFPPE